MFMTYHIFELVVPWVSHYDVSHRNNYLNILLLHPFIELLYSYDVSITTVLLITNNNDCK